MPAHQLEVLDEQLQDETLELSQDDVKERFKIENLEGLDWAFRKVAIYQKEFNEQKSLAEKNIAEFKQKIIQHEMWLEEERLKMERNASYFETLAAEYLKEQMAKNPKKKSISTPHGKIQSTTRKPSITKPEKDSLPQLIEYAEQNGFDEFIEVKKEIKWTDFKKELQLTDDLKVVDSNGQVVECIPISEGGTSFKITV